MTGKERKHFAKKSLAISELLSLLECERPLRLGGVALRIVERAPE